MSSNSFTVKPVNDLKSNGFFDSLSYENKERTRIGAETNHIAVYSNYARDLITISMEEICFASIILLQEKEVYISCL
jgi:hypothetical protein